MYEMRNGMKTDADKIQISITPETASKLDAISRRHDKPADALIAMAVDAMYASMPMTARKRESNKQKSP
jgi:hypothetical protein